MGSGSHGCGEHVSISASARILEEVVGMKMNDVDELDQYIHRCKRLEMERDRLKAIVCHCVNRNEAKGKA